MGEFSSYVEAYNRRYNKNFPTEQSFWEKQNICSVEDFDRFTLALSVFQSTSDVYLSDLLLLKNTDLQKLQNEHEAFAVRFVNACEP